MSRRLTKPQKREGLVLTPRDTHIIRAGGPGGGVRKLTLSFLCPYATVWGCTDNLPDYGGVLRLKTIP